MNNFTKIDLCSKALHKIGANEIVSFDEGSVEAEFVSGIYDVVKSKILSSFPWSFAKKIKKLNEIEQEDLNSNFSHVFKLPLDFLRIVSVFPNSSYDIMGDKLFTNSSQVEISYIYDVDESLFSPVFVSAFIYSLAAELSILLLDDNTKFNLFYKLFNTEIKEAKYLDSVQKTPKQINNFSLVDVRK